MVARGIAVTSPRSWTTTCAAIELRRAGIRSAGAAVQEVVFRELGVPLPTCHISVDEELPERHVVLSIHEVPASVFERAARMSPTRAWPRPAVDRVLETLRDRAADFLGIAETQVLLDQLEQIAPATVRQVVPKPVPLTLLADILRRLVEEGISRARPEGHPGIAVAGGGRGQGSAQPDGVRALADAPAHHA